MDKINIKDIDFSSLKKLELQGTKATLYKDKNKCIKILDGLYDSEKASLLKKFLSMEGTKIDDVILPEELIIKDGRLEGYTMEYFSHSMPLSNKFCVRYVDVKELFDYVLKASKILRSIHDNDIVCQDLSFENILVDKDGNVKFCDLDGCCYKGDVSPFISVMLKRFFIDYRKEQIIVCPNLDRISMLLSFFFIVYVKEIQKLSRREYHKLSDKIVTLDNLREYANRLIDRRYSIGEVPYLDEMICLSDDLVYDRAKQLSLFNKIFKR